MDTNRLEGFVRTTVASYGFVLDPLVTISHVDTMLANLLLMGATPFRNLLALMDMDTVTGVQGFQQPEKRQW
jgi:hypothetical protein